MADMKMNSRARYRLRRITIPDDELTFYYGTRVDDFTKDELVKICTIYADDVTKAYRTMGELAEL